MNLGERKSSAPSKRMAQTIDHQANGEQSSSIQVITGNDDHFQTLGDRSPSNSQNIKTSGTQYQPLRQNLVPKPRSSYHENNVLPHSVTIVS